MFAEQHLHKCADLAKDHANLKRQVWQKEYGPHGLHTGGDVMHEKGRTQLGTQCIQTCEEEYTFLREIENDCGIISLEPMLLIHCAFVLENSCRQEQGGDSTSASCCKATQSFAHSPCDQRLERLVCSSTLGI